MRFYRLEESRGNELPSFPFFHLMVVQTLQAILDSFNCFVKSLGMSVKREEIKPSEENKGILGLERDYEGGFAMLTIHRLAE